MWIINGMTMYSLSKHLKSIKTTIGLKVINTNNQSLEKEEDISNNENRYKRLKKVITPVTSFFSKTGCRYTTQKWRVLWH